jgi:hypothetical protein
MPAVVSSPTRTVARARLPGLEGKLEVVQNLISDPIIKRAHRGKDLRNPLHPCGRTCPRSTVPRQARGTAELCLGQAPQIGFRAPTAHILSVTLGRGPHIVQQPECRAMTICQGVVVGRRERVFLLDAARLSGSQ